MSRKEDFIQAGIQYRMKHGTPMAIGGGQFAEMVNNMNRTKPFEAGAEYGYRYAKTHPNWISVEDELPQIPEKWYCVEVLFRTKDSANHLGKYFGDDDKWISYEDYTFKTNDISHWMPIVPPRKEAKNDQTIRCTNL